MSDRELPNDPFVDASVLVPLWLVQEDFDDTDDDTVVLRFSREGWGWLHTLNDISSDGTTGYLDIRVDKDIPDHDDSAA